MMEERQSQRIARFAWVPFVAGLLMDERPGRTRYPPLGVDHPQGLTRDTVSDVAEIVKRGVWAYLVRTGGWRRTRYVDGTTGRVAEGRLWEASGLESASLIFSAGSIRLLLEAFNGLDTKDGPDASLPLDLSKSGDLLLHHIVFRRWAEDSRFDEKAARLFAGNPLSRLTHPHLFEPMASEPLLARLLDRDVAPFLPWLTHDWWRQWCLQEPLRLRSRHHVGRVSNRQNSVWSTWTRLVTRAERYDLLTPWIAFWARLDPLPALQDFEQLARDGRLQDRAALARPWVSLLELALELRDTSLQVRALHPVDREAAHQLFLTACGEHEFDRAVMRIERMIQSLRPSLGEPP